MVILGTSTCIEDEFKREKMGRKVVLWWFLVVLVPALLVT